MIKKQFFYLRAKIEYENILNNKTEGAILRSKTKIYEENEKSSKYFLNLEKQKAVRNTIKMLKKSPEIDSSITNPKGITKEIRQFYSNLFKKKENQSAENCKDFLNNLDLPKISEDLNEILKKPLTIEEIKCALMTSSKGKSPGNDGLGFEFFVVFWGNISVPLFESYLDGLKNNFVNISTAGGYQIT